MDSKLNIANTNFFVEVKLEEILSPEDTTPPTIFFYINEEVDANSAEGFIYDLGNPIEEDIIVVEDDVDDNPTLSCSPSILQLTQGYTFDFGENEISCIATDNAGNKIESSYTFYVVPPEIDDPIGNPDTVDPVVYFSDDLRADIEAYSANGATYAEGDPRGILFWAIDSRDGNVNDTLWCDEVTVSALTDGYIFPLGLNTLTCYAKDSAGNVGKGSITFTVIAMETEDPTVDPPEDPDPNVLPFELSASFEENSYVVSGLFMDTRPIQLSVNPGESIDIRLAGTNGGAIQITLPNDMISGIHTVQSTDGTIEWQQDESTSEFTTISFEVPPETSRVSILGSHVVPEFGTIVVLILAVAIISTIAITSKSNLSIMPRP